MKGLVLSLCDRTGNMVRPWADAGWDCLCVDIQHTGIRVEGNIEFLHGDLRWWTLTWAKPAVVFAFPPCTNLANSGARWFRDKGLRGLIDGLELVERCRAICEESGAPWMLENPVGQLATYWRPPDYRFDPYEYGGYPGGENDGYTKRTCLWTGGGFVMPPRRPIDGTEGSRMHLIAPSGTRADERSVTPMGFARAVFEANAERVAA